MRVLLVEDNTELVSLLKKGLSHGGFSADPVGTAADAVHVLSTMRYAAIVLDLGLPDEDGTSRLRATRRRGDSTPVPLPPALADAPHPPTPPPPRPHPHI